MFVLDPSIGSFVLVKSKIRIPETGKIYSVNEANRATFPAGFSRYLDWAHAERLLEPLHRIDGRRRAPHAAEGRRLPLSADEEEPGRQAAADVRSESDRA